jgi:hypothetical protein
MITSTQNHFFQCFRAGYFMSIVSIILVPSSNARGEDEWGIEHDGLRTRLVPAQQVYVIGQPAKFRLELKNFGNRERAYDSQGVDVNGRIQVKNQDGKPVPYVRGSFQTAGHSKSIAPGTTAILFDGIDLAEQYLFIKPGTYTLQFLGTDVIWKLESKIPPSDKITIEMKPGTLPLSMQVPARLIEILPEKWYLTLNRRVYEVEDDMITPPGWESGRGTYVSINSVNSNKEGGVPCVKVWVAENKLTWIGKVRTKKVAKPDESAIYLGKGADGHVYMIIPEKAEKEWPDMRDKVRSALRIENMAPKTS